MSKDLYDELAERARYFLRISRNDSINGRYDIALFHLEQALQLGVKAYLLREKGDFPRIHDLSELIELSDNYCLKRLGENRWYVVSILSDAYIGSRYLPRKYSEREYRSARKFVEDALKCVNIINA
jgi:HEPN domain-containing protein